MALIILWLERVLAPIYMRPGHRVGVVRPDAPGSLRKRLCKLVGEISVHALVRVPDPPPRGHSRPDGRSRATTPTQHASPTPNARARPQSGTLGVIRDYSLVEGSAF